MKGQTRKRWFWLGCLFEIALLVVAVLLGWLFNQPVFTPIRRGWRDAMIGCLASIPLFLLFRTMLRLSWKPLAEIRQFLETAVLPTFAQWSLTQLAVISLLAGLGEELLFRGVVQGALTRWIGPLPAIIGASLLFGLCHPITWAYATVASFIGAYLSGLWLLTGNLLAPVVTHALYDFMALAYFLRLHKPSAADTATLSPTNRPSEGEP